MKIRKIMSPTVGSIDADDTIAYAARRMADDDIGAFPVLSRGNLVGIVTDRDLVVRGIAEGLSPNAPVRWIMTSNVKTCGPDDDLGTALAIMSRERIRRLPICHGRVEIVGMLTLADAAMNAPDLKDVAATLRDICEPHGQESRAALFA